MISSASSPTSTSPERVGGKAASLFRLVQLGFRVPPFFVITADTHRKSRGKLSKALKAQILDEWNVLGGDSHAYAVRSSSRTGKESNSSSACSARPA